MGDVPSTGEVWGCGSCVVVGEPTSIYFLVGRRERGVGTIYAVRIVQCSKVHNQGFIYRIIDFLVYFGVCVGGSSSDDAIDVVRRGLLAYAPH